MVNIIKFAEIKIEEVFASKLRLDANVFNIEGREAKKTLEKCKWEIKNLCGSNGIAKAYHRLRFKRIFVEKSDFPIYQPAQIVQLYPKPYKYISHLTKTNIEALRVRKGQILMTCSGTIGKNTMVSKLFDNKIFSHDLIRINTNEKEDTGFVYAYLNTYIGQHIIKTNNYGAVIKHIEPEHLNNVQIPYPKKEIRLEIHNLILESFDLRDQANGLIDKAENLLIEELKLPPIENLEVEHLNNQIKSQTFAVKLELLNDRLDASYHNPVVNSILDYFLDNAEIIKPLINLCTDITMPGIFKRVYVESNEGVPFLGTSDMLELNPKVEKFLSKKVHKKLIDKHLKLKANTILQSNRGSVSVGKVAFVPEYYVEQDWVASQNVLRIIVENIDIAGYIYIFLNSDYGKILSRREIYGSTIDMIDPSKSGQIPIPILKDKEIMKKINTLALEANKLRTEAYYKEKEAIKIMNEEVIYATK